MTRFLLRMFIVLALAPAVLWAQGQASDQPGPPREPSPGPSPYGNGERPRLRYAGDNLRRNVLFFGLAQETAWDDNVLNTNEARFSDVSFGLGLRLGFQQQRKSSAVAVDYRPDLLLYREVSRRNSLNQALEFDAYWQPHARLAFRMREKLAHQTGIFAPPEGEPLMPGLASPSDFNTSVYTQLLRQFETNTRADAFYQKSFRTSVNFFGGFLMRDFRKDASVNLGLLDHQGVSGGAQYAYRLSRDTTVSGLYVFQNLQIGPSRAAIHGMYFSMVHQLSPRLRLDAWGGPQRADLDDRFTLELPLFGTPLQVTGRAQRTRWRAAGGGGVTASTENTAMLLTFQRTVNDGGGFLVGAVGNEELAVHVRRRMARRWHAGWHLNLSRAATIDSPLGEGRISGQSTGVSLEHTLRENLSARLNYSFIHQRSRGSLPAPSAIDRNRISFGLAWQVSKTALGR